MITPLEKSCEANMPEGCRFLSLVHWNGEEDRKANPELAEKACELEDAEACWLLSTWYIGPDADFVTLGATKAKHSSHLGKLPRNIDLAIKYGIRACDFGCFQSCANVSRLYNLGDGIERDPVKAKLYLDKAKEAYKRALSGDKVDFTG
uniref:Sel1 repeat family protein n=1 Tax=Elaeophora elaphi TaxID=1147741 RepID=A0A0R3RGA2_9BILA